MTTESRRNFASILDEARRKRHLSIRDAARIAEVPTATMQGWLNGKHFPVPALRRNYLRIVEELGLSAEAPADLWDDAWVDLQPNLRTRRPPYLGLRPFGCF